MKDSKLLSFDISTKMFCYLIFQEIECFIKNSKNIYQFLLVYFSEDKN